MTVDLTEDELIFLRACFFDSRNEGHFNYTFQAIDRQKVEAALRQKGILPEKEEDDAGTWI